MLIEPATPAPTPGGGVVVEGADIECIELPYDEALAMVRDGRADHGADFPERFEDGRGLLGIGAGSTAHQRVADLVGRQVEDGDPDVT